MSFEQLMQSIALEQRDAGERAVIRHLEAQGLVTPAMPRQEPISLTNIAQAMYKKYIRTVAEAQQVSVGSYEVWNDLPEEHKLGLIAAAGEAVALVAAMNSSRTYNVEK